MGANSSSMDDLMLENIDGYSNLVQKLTPVNLEGQSLKLSDNATQIVHDLVITKSVGENVQLEEYIIQVDNNNYLKHRDFVIIGKDLCNCLRSSDLLNSDMRFETKPRLTESYCLSKFSMLEFKSKKYYQILELISFIKDSCPIFAKLDESIANGIVTLNAIEYYLKIGTKVVLHGKEIKQGAVINKVLNGKVSCETISQNRHGNFVECEISIKLDKPSYTLDELHQQIQPINENDEIYQKLKSRGANIVASKGKIQYLNYSGPVFIAPNVISNYEDNIRVIWDLYNDIPNSYNERLERIGSDRKELDYVSKEKFFSVLGSVSVYHIKQHRYISIEFDCLEPIKFNENCYEELVMDEKYKRFLSLATNNVKVRELQLDSIKGKGNSLLFVLSGPPGVGKTMTAEALSEKNHVPLITVSFGTLGVDPSTVESALNQYMKIAKYWNAILLFDEADVFLGERKVSSYVSRNAIVGVFLQALEYHQGIVFLTTNRDTSLDSAILSRAVLKIEYPYLTFNQSLFIWKTMLTKVISTNQVDDIIIKLQENNASTSRHIQNGREIRNIIYMAMIFAQGKDLTYDDIKNTLMLNGDV